MWFVQGGGDFRKLLTSILTCWWYSTTCSGAAPVHTCNIPGVYVASRHPPEIDNSTWRIGVQLRYPCAIFIRSCLTYSSSIWKPSYTCSCPCPMVNGQGSAAAVRAIELRFLLAACG